MRFQAELDRFVNALIAIRAEIREVEQGKADKCALLLLPCLSGSCLVSALHSPLSWSSKSCMREVPQGQPACGMLPAHN